MMKKHDRATVLITQVSMSRTHRLMHTLCVCVCLFVVSSDAHKALQAKTHTRPRHLPVDLRDPR